MKAEDHNKETPLLGLAASAALVLGAILRFLLFHRQLPLWVDEAWTGAIVNQLSINATITQILLDPNPPLYFILMYSWTKVFGLSDTALRLPSLVFGLIAPLIAFVPSKGIARSARLLWGSLLALSPPGIWYSQEARCYSLAFLLAIACTLSFVRLLQRPNTLAAAGWGALACSTVLTEYHALLLVSCQAICYLAVHRKRCLSTWPAALTFLPAVIWMVLHIPRVLQYADPSVSIFSAVEFSTLAEIFNFVGADLIIVALSLLAVLAMGLAAKRSNYLGNWRQSSQVNATAWLAAGAAALGAILLVAIGWLRPSFTLRYLMVFVPGILLGVSLLITRLTRISTLAPIAILFLYCIPACALLSEHYPPAEKKMIWSFERASRELETAGLDQLIFFLDVPLAGALEPIQLKMLGSFFFQRAGLAIPVTLPFLDPDDDPNSRLLALANTPRSAILWLYDLTKKHTAAVSHPNRIEQLDSNWTCNNFGDGNVGVVACHHK